jgi:hypothetical protein
VVRPAQPSPYGTQTAAVKAKVNHGGGISMQTLIIASVASAVSSYTCSKIWGPGTLFSAAASPIIVAFVSEFVRRPVTQVSSTAQRVSPLRYRPQSPSTAPLTPPRPADLGGPAADPSRFPPPPPAYAPAAVPWSPPGEAPPTGPAGLSPPAADAPWTQDSQPAALEATRTGPRWRLVLATGLVACLIVVGLFTALDVLAGQSITGSGNTTTFWSGHSTPKKAPAKTPATPPLGATGTTSSATGATGATGTTAPSTSAGSTSPVPTPAVGATAGPTGTSGASGATGATTPSASQQATTPTLVP